LFTLGVGLEYLIEGVLLPQPLTQGSNVSRRIGLGELS
jgi:hypothetical protein